MSDPSKFAIECASTLLSRYSSPVQERAAVIIQAAIDAARTAHHAEMSAALENTYYGKSKSIPPDWLIRAMEDRARLDWLEETGFKIQINQCEDEDFEVKWGDLLFYGKTLRLAIDSAMKKARE